MAFLISFSAAVISFSILAGWTGPYIGLDVFDYIANTILLSILKYFNAVLKICLSAEHYLCILICSVLQMQSASKHTTTVRP